MSQQITLPEGLKENLEKNGQAHLLDFLPKIEKLEDKQKYIESLASTNFSLMSQLYMNLKNQKEKTATVNEESNFSPIKEQFTKDSFTKEEQTQFVQKGYDEINSGHVALLLLAGGLGTRLGFDKPKGIYNIGMPSNKPLFGYFSSRFKSIQNLAQKHSKTEHKNSTLFVMTSQHTFPIISSFFKENNFFGLEEKDVVFFPQSEICGLTSDGKVVSLSEKELYKAPDGNGGCFTGMRDNKILDICNERNIQYINVISVDNPLYKVLDPFYVGMTILKGRFGLEQMSAKCLKKSHPTEKVGHFLNFKGHPMMMDYMEIPQKLMEAKNEKGDLKYSACNILDYIIGVKFLNKILNDEAKFKELISMFHFINKKTDCVVLDENKNVVEKKNEPFVKFEIFFNSIFEFSEEGSLLLLEIEREEEFAPVKNKEGEPTNTASATRKKMSNLFKKWYTLSGGKILNDSDDKILEISFLDCYDQTYDNMFENRPDIPREIDFKDKSFILL